ncbi:ECF-type sigma factor [Hyphococcus sp.]|uniref:ECF-type sigma factor n=1 Tax=Hyphococcus sp. TaxID=2038636 RepID=UPI00208B00BB|nr:MAG: extracytoplasmic sigma factor ECF [Marinicaulis sp.]
MAEDEPEIMSLLSASRAGNEAASARLDAAVYAELSAIAAILLRREGKPVSLATSDLVNEAAVRLLQSAEAPPVERAHFMALSARIMRNVLVDAARKRGADKRRKITVTLHTDQGAANENPMELIALETALMRLKAIDPERAEIVVMRYFGSMTTEDIALHLGISESTVKRSWRAACAWLKGAIENDGL